MVSNTCVEIEQGSQCHFPAILQNPRWIRNVTASACHVRSSCIAGIMAKDQGASAPKMLFHSMDELDLELRL